MNVSLTPELEAQIQAFIRSGLYGNQSEVVRAGLRLLLEREEERVARLEALRADIQVGVDQMRKGDLVETTAEEFKSRMKRT